MKIYSCLILFVLILTSCSSAPSASKSRQIRQLNTNLFDTYAHICRKDDKLACKKAIAYSSGLPRPMTEKQRILLGSAYFVLGNYDSALYWLSPAAHQNGNLDIINIVGLIYQKKGQLEKAYHYFNLGCNSTFSKPQKIILCQNAAAAKSKIKKIVKIKPPTWLKKLFKYQLTSFSSSNEATFAPDGSDTLWVHHFGPFDISCIDDQLETAVITGKIKLNLNNQIVSILRSHGIRIDSSFDMTTAFVRYILDIISRSGGWSSHKKIPKIERMAMVAWALTRAQNAGDITLINRIINDFSLHILKKIK